MAPRSAEWAAVFAAVILSACGSASLASSASPSVPTPPPTPSPTPAPHGCPTAAVVGAALGVTLPKPVGVPYSGGPPLPAGASGIACEYHASTYNVIIEIITNISPSYVSSFTARFPVAAVKVSGVGDQAFAFSAPIGGGRVNEGVVASKGKTIVSCDATATPASLAQVEALVNQLL